jgi:hypothetical protein
MQNDIVITLLKAEEAKTRLQVYGDYWESLSPENRWGGNFPKWYPGSDFLDPRHFERHV